MGRCRAKVGINWSYSLVWFLSPFLRWPSGQHRRIALEDLQFSTWGKRTSLQVREDSLIEIVALLHSWSMIAAVLTNGRAAPALSRTFLQREFP